MQTGADGMPMQADLRLNTVTSSTTSANGPDKKFAVYGSRSLQFGGEFLSALLCQYWEVPQPHQ